MTMAIASTMQPAQLGIARLLRHIIATTGTARLDYRQDDQLISCQMLQVALRSAQLGRALANRGIGRGSVLATYCSATREHLECYLGIPAHGAVLHTLNIRMHDTDLAAMIHEMGDIAIFVSSDLAHQFARVAPQLVGSALRLVVLCDSRDKEPASSGFPDLSVETISYEALLAEIEPVGAEGVLALNDPPEESAAVICHTGGTTGKPKAVAYSHRSLWLQANSLCTANSLGISRRDTVLPAIPLYHVNGWGLPFAAAMAGANLVLPGASFRPEHINRLVNERGVTLGAGVPTIWIDLLKLRVSGGEDRFRTLKRVATGGAVIPQRLIADLSHRGVEVIQAWGMTETSSMSVIGEAGPAEGDIAASRPVGQVVCGLEIRIVASDGTVRPRDGVSVGEIQIRGPWITERYFANAAADAFDCGWLRTGDIGTVDSDGRLTLTDRLKDAVKSGGEWIPAQALEDVLRTLPGIVDAAIIGVPHERWQERPVAVIVLADPDGGPPPELGTSLKDEVPNWWIPDGWATIDALPRTTLGKPDKARLRAMLAGGELKCREL